MVVGKDGHASETDSALEMKMVEELRVFDEGVSETRPEGCGPRRSVILGFVVDDVFDGHHVDNGCGRHDEW